MLIRESRIERKDTAGEELKNVEEIKYLEAKGGKKENNTIEPDQHKKTFSEEEVYIATHFNGGEKIKAIKWYRDKTGVDLKEGKEIVEKILENAKEIKMMEDERQKKEIVISKKNDEMKYISCPCCSKKISKMVKFCNFCGAKIEETIICKSCGKTIASDAKFCNFCGQRTKEE